MTSIINRLSASTGHRNLVVAREYRAKAQPKNFVHFHRGTTQCSRSRETLQVHAFLPGALGAKIWKQAAQLAGRLDTKGKEERLAVLRRFYTQLDRATADSLLSPDFRMKEAGGNRVFGRDAYLDLLYGAVLPAVPDFSWGFASTGEVDDEGWVLVTVTATGHHKGAAFTLPGLPLVEPSGKHFCLAEEVQKVKVHNGQVTEVMVLPARGAGPRALYYALSGEVPPTGSAQAVPPMP